jgi:hypothetical protein
MIERSCPSDGRLHPFEAAEDLASLKDHHRRIDNAFNLVTLITSKLAGLAETEVDSSSSEE